MATKLAVIFDMDGVLVDSFPAHCEAWKRAAEREGLAFDAARFSALFGRVSRDIIAALWGDEHFSEPERLAFDDRRESIYREIVGENFPAMPGAKEVILALAADGFALALGSSGPRENGELVLRKFGVRHLFGAVVAGGDVKRGKPDPEIFLTAAEKLGVPPARCVVIEDAGPGIAAANAAGMACIGLAAVAPSREALFAASTVVDTMNQISPALIRQMIGTDSHI